MPDRYDVVLTGRIAPGATIGAVKSSLSARTGLTPARVDELFAQAPVVIRRDQDHAQAVAYRKLVEEGTGAICEVVPAAEGRAPGPADAAAAPAPAPAPAVAGGTSGERPDQDLDPVTVGAGRGWAWIVYGFRSFARNPVAWVAIVVIGFLIMALSSLIPIVGAVAPNLLSPVLLGGLMIGCREQDRGGALQVRHLFAGFSGSSFGPLIGVGGMGFALSLVIVVALTAVFLFGLGGMAMLADMQGGGGPGQMNAELASRAMIILVLALLGLALYLPVLMALWLAPALVAVGAARVLRSLRLSFVGCLRNWLAFLVNGLAWLPLMLMPVLAALISPVAGAVLVLAVMVVVIPVVIASVYGSFRDIFPGAARRRDREARTGCANEDGPEARAPGPP